MGLPAPGRPNRGALLATFQSLDPVGSVCPVQVLTLPQARAAELCWHHAPQHRPCPRQGHTLLSYPATSVWNVLGWFLTVPHHGKASTLRVAHGITNSRVQGGGPCAARSGTSPALSPALPPAKLDPPTLQSIQSIPFQTDCVSVAWEVARSNAYMELQCELRYRAPDDPDWALVSAAGASSRSWDPPLRSELCWAICNGSSRAPHGRGTARLQPAPAMAGASIALAPAAPRSQASWARPALHGAVASSSARGTASRCGAGGARHGATGASGVQAGTTPPTRKVSAQSPRGPLCLAGWHGPAGPAGPVHPPTFPSPATAPMGKLDAWWSTGPAGAGRRTEVQLRWKVSAGG